MGKKALFINVLWFVLVLGLIYVSISYLGISDIREKVEGLGAWGPLVLILAKASTLVFAPLGGAPLYPVAGALFGTLNGFVYVMVGDALGSTVCFFISRKCGRRVVHRFVTDSGMPIVERLLGHMGTVRGFIETRLFFIGLPEAVSYAAGLTRLPFKTFIIINTLAYIVPNAFFVWAGSTLVTLGPLYATLYMVFISLLVVCGMAVLFWRARKLAPDVTFAIDVSTEQPLSKENPAHTPSGKTRDKAG